MNKFILRLKKLLKFRPEAVDWCINKGFTSITQAWAQCDDPYWLLLYAGIVSGTPGSPARKKLAKCCDAVAQQVLPIWQKMPPGYLSVPSVVTTDEELDAEGVYANAGRSIDCAAQITRWRATSTAACLAAGAYTDGSDANYNTREKFRKDSLMIVRKFYPKAPKQIHKKRRNNDANTVG